MNEDYKKKFVEPKNIVGKTVQLVHSSYDNDIVVIKFTDGSILALQADIEWEDMYLNTTPQLNSDTLIALGFVTEEEVEEQERIKREQWQKAERENKLETYNRLKKELFGGENP